MPSATASEFDYDRVPYPGSADWETHPRHLEGIAWLRGLQPTELTGCRVLEIGCASGRNLLPMASEFPNSQFVGIDLAGEQIQEAASSARQLQLKNVEFHHASLTEIDSSWGEFDYALCLGVFSWVATDAQNKVLSILRSHLAPQGVAVISYKTYPGWYQLDVLRDALRMAADREEPALQVKKAREYLSFLANGVPEDAPNGRLYRNEHAYLSEAEDHYLFHDYLADHSDPLYFRDFHRRVVGHELQYLGELNFTCNALPTENPSTREFLTRLPLVDRYQALDFLNNRSYRKSIICPGAARLNSELDVSQLQRLKVSLNEVPKPAEFPVGTSTPQSFDYASGRFTVAAPFGKAALRYLIDVYPRSVSISELCRGANQRLPSECASLKSEGERGEQLLSTAMLAALQAGLVKVCLHAPDFAEAVSARPLASPLVRMMAARTKVVVNHCHQNVRLGADAASLLAQLDGTRSTDELLNTVASEELPGNQQSLERVLAELCASACLVG